MDYEYAEYTPDFLDQIVALRIREWGEDPRFSERYLAWKYEQNPYSDKPLFYLALSAGKVVGMRGFYGGTLSVGPTGRSHLVASGSDTLIAQEHRGQRLFARLNSFALDDLARLGCDYALSLSANRTSELLSLRSRWLRACSFQPVYLGEASGSPAQVRKKDSRLSAEIRRARSYPGVRNAWAQYRRFASNRREPEFKRLDAWAMQIGAGSRIAVEAAVRPERMAELVRSQGRDETRISMVRDKRYYDWRFGDPRSAYRFVYAQSADNKLDGFMVLQQAHSGIDVAIADWQAISDDVWWEMLLAVMESGCVLNLRTWSATLPPTLLQRLLAHGFRAVPEVDTRAYPAQGLLITSTHVDHPSQNWTLDERPLLAPEEWDLRMIFSDLY